MTSTNSDMTNAMDFVYHGLKTTSVGMIEHQFDVSQTGSLPDSKNVALSGFSLQSDMLTSAYFNSEVGDLRQNLGAYQIKIDPEQKKHRAVFVGGSNNRDGNSSAQVDVNVGNYPVDSGKELLDHTGSGTGVYDTNTGRDWKNGEGIPNINLKGNSFQSKMPIYPLTNQNPEINSSSVDATVLSQFSKTSSFIDAIELIKNIFGLSTLNYNLNNVKYINNLGNTITNADFISPNASNTHTPINKNIYISLTSAVTQWVKLAGIKITIGSLSTSNYDGLVNSNKQPINIISVDDFSVKLIIDGFYCPRLMIGNGMSNQQLFVWTEGSMGDSSNSIIKTNSLLQFNLSQYLVANDLSSSVNFPVTKVASNKLRLNFGTNPVPNNNEFIYVKKSGATRGYIYQVISVTTSLGESTLTINYSVPSSGNYEILVLPSVELYKCYRFNIDEIRDRYSMLQLISHIDNIYETCTGLTIPLKLIEYLSQVKGNNTLDKLLKYVSLFKLFNAGNSSTIDSGKKLNQIFHFIQNDNNYYSFSEGATYGRSLKHWNDLTDSVDTGDLARFTCLNTQSSIILPQDWNTATNKSPSGLIKSYNTLRQNRVKHVVITNLPGFKNGRYGTSMSSSNLINGFFGSLSIDLSYSDTHTPVDINGMTVHQWDINNFSNTFMLDGQNDPARWNVNADEEYIKNATNSSINP